MYAQCCISYQVLVYSHSGTYPHHDMHNICLLMHGVRESVNENTDILVLNVINNELGVQLSLKEIQRSHRLGPKNTRRNRRNTKANIRPIIFKFMSNRKRQEVFKAKRNLKGKHVSIPENLTRARCELYRAAINKFSNGHVWTSEGRITTKQNNEYIIINNLKDLEDDN